MERERTKHEEVFDVETKQSKNISSIPNKYFSLHLNYKKYTNNLTMKGINNVKHN